MRKKEEDLSMNAVLTKEKQQDSHGRNESLTQNEKVYETKGLNLWYGETQALKNINLDIYQNEVTAIIGPSGCRTR